MSVAVCSARPTSPTPRRWWKTKSCLAAAAITGAFVCYGADRQPADATRPVEIRGTVSSPEDGRLRVGTFNIHGGRGPDGVVDLDATASLMDEQAFDLVGLYEVHGAFTTDQAAELGERLGMASVFAATERRWWHDHFGNGVLIGCPVRSVLRITLPGTQGKRYRNALLTKFDVDGTTVHVISAHIDTETDRERQLAVVTELFRSLKGPVILMGDLNCTTDHPALAGLLAEDNVVDALAAVERQSRNEEKNKDEEEDERIDHVLARGLTVVEAGIVDTTASDHPYVWAELAILTEPPRR